MKANIFQRGRRRSAVSVPGIALNPLSTLPHPTRVAPEPMAQVGVPELGETEGWAAGLTFTRDGARTGTRGASTTTPWALQPPQKHLPRHQRTRFAGDSRRGHPGGLRRRSCLSHAPRGGKKATR